MNRWTPIPLAAVLVSATTALAQMPTPSPEPAEKMRALEFLVGEWEGESSMQMGPDRRESATVREHAEWLAGGEVLQIRGQGRSGDRIVHDAVAVIAWDPQTRGYVMWSYRAGAGPTHDTTIEVGDKQVVWGFDSPRGKIRFTIRLDDQGRWVETGEWSGDGGATWHPNFGMTLTRN